MTKRRRLIIGAALVALLALPVAALADWPQTGSGSAYSKAHSMPAGNTPTASVSGRDVTVSWSASSGSVPVDGYLVKRYDTGGQAQTILSNCSGTVTGTSCTENSVPGGTWRYTVTPVRQNWQGAESSQSTDVTVSSAAMTLSPAVVSSLPATLTGQITGFVAGQTVTFRLDNQTTGTVLSGSITPSPVPANGTASVSVTIPAGTSNGPHTLYAVGSGGDIASDSVTVSAPTAASTSAWDLRDASGGSGEQNQSDPLSFSGDSRFTTTTSWSSSFSTSRYVTFDYNNPLNSGSASSVSFKFNFAAPSSGQTVCFYFEVYRASTSTLIGTHGSSSSPVACQTGTTFSTTSTMLSEVTSAAIANDLQVKVYGRNTSSAGMRIDLATVAATVSSQAYTLYQRSFVDAADTTPATTPWSVYASGDGAYFVSNTSVGWSSSWETNRYLKFTFPAYVPTSATLNSVTFKHSYRIQEGGPQCFYYQVLAGSTVLGTHGSSSSPYSCNSSGTTYVTDTVSLPEVTTLADANNLVVKAYGQNSNGKYSQSDLVQLDLSYNTSPNLTLASGTITSLPSTKTGTINNFTAGQTVAFRLDDPETGTPLSGSITPSPVPASGTSDVSLTIPTGTSNGTHTVYAIGSGGEIASAPVTVDRSTTANASAWSLADASAGAGESDRSDTLSFAGDSRFTTTTNWSTAYSTSRYVSFSFNNPLKSGGSVSAASFDFNFAANASGQTVCFYLQTFRTSTSTLIGTHGSTSSPVACQTGTTFSATSTSLAEVTSTEIANDLSVVVYATNSASSGMRIDRATSAVTSAGQGYALYEKSFVDAADTTAATTTWGLYASGDSAFYETAAGWSTAFSTSRYLKLTFPAYVPTAATLDGVTFKHTYRSGGAGTTCYYFEVLAGSTLLGTHGSSSSPYSCNSSSTTYVTDTVSLPEVTSVADANNLVVKLYVRNSSSGDSQHDLGQMQLTYTAD